MKWVKWFLQQCNSVTWRRCIRATHTHTRKYFLMYYFCTWIVYTLMKRRQIAREEPTNELTTTTTNTIRLNDFGIYFALKLHRLQLTSRQMFAFAFILYRLRVVLVVLNLLWIHNELDREEIIHWNGCKEIITKL